MKNVESKKIQEITDYVLAAQDGKYEIKKITEEIHPQLTIAEAYTVQEELIKRKIHRGEKIVGPKMGLTSLAKLKQMHVKDPIYGYVFDTMVVKEGDSMKVSDYIHPKVEPEIGFIMMKELKGPGVTKEDVLEAAYCLFPGIEIIDSRYLNFDFTTPDVIADNTSAAGAVFGAYLKDFSGIDLEAIEVALKINGETKTTGTGAAVLGHPAESIATLANMLAEKGESVQAGQPILTGGITAAVVVQPGDYVEVSFSDGLGSVELKVE